MLVPYEYSFQTISNRNTRFHTVAYVVVLFAYSDTQAASNTHPFTFSVAKKVRVIKKSSEKSEARADDYATCENVCVYDGAVRGRATAPSRIYVIQLQNSKRQSNNKNAIAKKNWIQKGWNE